jgi:hypothetical protein
MFDQAVNMLGLPGLEVAELVTVFRRHRPSIALYPGVSQMLRRLRTNMQLGLLTDDLVDVIAQLSHATQSSLRRPLSAG